MVETISDKKPYKKELETVLSDHFDKIKQPVSVSLGLHLKSGQTVEDIVNLLRKDGICAVPYYDEKVKDDLSLFVVDGTGIRSPFFNSPEDAVRATRLMVNIMQQNDIETSRAMPITKDNLIEAIPHTYTGNIIDIAKNNSDKENVDNTLFKYLKYAAEKMPDTRIPKEDDKDFTSKTHIYRGGFLGDKPYAVTFNRRYRDCAYGTNRLSEAIKYSIGANLGRGLHYKEIEGKSYAFVYEFKQSKGQKFYDMAGAERPFATPEKKQTAHRPDYRLDYETLIIKDRNPLSAIYLRVDDKLVQIADEKGFFKQDGMDWKEFAKLHTPKNTGELNDYLVERMNKQITEFPTFTYPEKARNLLDIFKHKEQTKSLGIYEQPLNINGLTFKDKNKKTDYGTEIENASLNSLKISESIGKVRLSGDLTLCNCALAPNVDMLDISDCKGNICMAHMKYMPIKPPRECESFTLSCVKIPQGDTLDLSEMKCKKMTLEDVDLSGIKNLKLPQDIEELKFRYNVRLPENIDCSGAKHIIFDKKAKPDYAQTKSFVVSDDVQIEVENTTDKDILKNKIKNENINIQTRTGELPVTKKLREFIKQNKDTLSIDKNETEAQTIMRKSGRITPAKSEINTTNTEKTQTISATMFYKYGCAKNRSYGE